MVERAEPFITITITVTDAPTWSTSSFSGSADTSPMDLWALGQHLAHCRHAHGRLFTLQCAAGTLNRFLSARLVTTLVAATLLIGAGSLVL